MVHFHGGLTVGKRLVGQAVAWKVYMPVYFTLDLTENLYLSRSYIYIPSVYIDDL